MTTTIDDMVESKYTKKEDVGEGTVVTFTGYTKSNVAMDDEPQRIRIVASFLELKKPVVLNRTNLKKMAKLAGTIVIDDWIGKRFVLFNDETVTYAGEEIGGIRVRAATAPKAVVSKVTAAKVAARTSKAPPPPDESLPDIPL
jgi:hypothetical protein